MTNKNILITGATQGIGYSTAKILSKNYNVFICGRNEIKLRENAVKLGCRGFFAVDLTQKGAVELLYRNAIDTLGNIDVLINNAGQYFYGGVEKTSKDEIYKLLTLNTKDEDLNRLVELNMIAPFKLCRLVVPSMKEKKFGRIINIGSISGVVGEGNASLYSMTKSALTGMTKALALELAEFGITVNTINPGWVDTNLAENEDLKAEFSQQELLDMIPQRRFVHPEEVGRMCEYLISDSAKGITGQGINICAGLTLG